jgi:MFS family permease
MPSYRARLRGIQANWRAVVLGGVLGAGLSVGIGAGALALARSSTKGEGPTAATLDEGFSALWGYEFGIALGLGVMGALVRNPGRKDGLLATTLAYLLGIPGLVAAFANDLGPLEYLLILAFLGGITMVVGIAGAAAGAWIGRRFRRG